MKKHSVRVVTGHFRHMTLQHQDIFGTSAWTLWQYSRMPLRQCWRIGLGIVIRTNNLFADHALHVILW